MILSNSYFLHQGTTLGQLGQDVTLVFLNFSQLVRMIQLKTLLLSKYQEHLYYKAQFTKLSSALETKPVLRGVSLTLKFLSFRCKMDLISMAV
jgi:hypothetical protein